MTTNELASKKILFATYSSEGHINPLTGMAKHLQGLGCEVKFYVSDHFDAKMKSIGIDYYPISKANDSNSETIRKQYPELITTNDPVEKHKIYQKILVKTAKDSFEDIQDIYSSFPFDLVITTCAYLSIPLIRYKFQVPVVSVGVIPLAEDEETGAKNTPLPQENAINFKEGSNPYAELLTAQGVPYQKAEIVNILKFLTRQASLYLQIGTPEFEYKHDHLGENIRYVGALSPYLKPASENKWYDERLEKYAKIVFVTQGTVESDTAKLIEPTLQAFINTDTLVIATTGGKGTQLLKEKYVADNLIIEDYIPYADVMPYASAYITNGGYGGTILSIRNRLPLVAAGLHEGKNEVCARIGYFKIGIDLKTESPTSQAIYDAVQEILENKVYKDNIVNLSDDMNTYNPLALSVKYIKELLNKES
ncbi:glycosyltransferase, MGT family [Pedobacter hartonius]|uniref:Glycosyltransferase, MGT family n=2 Tax=Pedobacter hartonius TaxID=425514 RepID=A0A1H4G7S2_9SPHI|nr:glycosyltransferase, MGT family [Pedobacter hartonius]